MSINGGINEQAIDLAARIDALGGGGFAPGPDEAAVIDAARAAAEEGAAAALRGDIAPPPAPPSVETPRVPSQAVGRPAPTTAKSVGTPVETLRIYRTNSRGKQEFIGDYNVREISAGGGDIEGFVWRTLAPRFNGGTYVIYKLDRTGPVLYTEVSIPDERRDAPAAPTTPSQPSPSFDQAAAAMRAAREDERQAQEAAIRRMRDEEARITAAQAAEAARGEAERKAREAERAEIMALVEKKGAGDPMLTMLLMERLRAPATPTAPVGPDPGLVAAIQDLRQQVAMIQMQPPPMPPMLPPPDPKASLPEIVTAITAALGAVTAPILAVWQESRANALTAEKVVGLAASVVTVMRELGMVGGEKVTRSDLLAAEMKAKLDILTSGGDEDPLERIAKVVQLVDTLRPRESGTKDLLAVIDHTVEKLPEIADSLGRLVLLRGASGDEVAAAATTRKGAGPPAALTAMRRDVLAAAADASLEAAAKAARILQTVIPGLAGVHKAGGAWAEDVQALATAARAEDVATVKQRFARIVRRAWPVKDEEATRFFRAVMGVWARYSAEVAVALGAKRPAAEAAPEAEPDVDDLVGGSDVEAETAPEAEEDAATVARRVAAERRARNAAKKHGRTPDGRADGREPVPVVATAIADAAS